jgi:ribosomal protein L16/L10AE
MFEVGGVQPELAREALHLAAHKLPIAVRLMEREAAVTAL